MIEFVILKDLPVKELEKFEDQTIYTMARSTLDYTLCGNNFPLRTGNLLKSSMAQGVRQEKQNVYCLDVPAGAEYAEYVWEMPQETNWTNPQTLAQWYASVFENKKELIVHNAVNTALRSVK